MLNQGDIMAEENKIKTVEEAKKAFDTMNTTTKTAIVNNVKRDFINAAMKNAREKATKAFTDMSKNDVLSLVYKSMLNAE